MNVSSIFPGSAGRLTDVGTVFVWDKRLYCCGAGTLGLASRLQREVENPVSCPAAQLPAVQPQQRGPLLTAVNHTLAVRSGEEERK